jgi:Holliday junction resolvase
MQKTDNRTNGGRFEQEFAEILFKNGFWAHVMQQNKSGQPSDIIAVKGKFHTMIDAKVCEKGEFPFDRIEENQKTAMRMFQRRCGELCYFALKIPADGGGYMIRLVSLERLMTLLSRGEKQLSRRTIENETWSLEKWLESAETWSEDV